MQYEVAFKELPAQTITSVRRTVTLDDLPSYVGEAILEMRRVLREGGVPETGSPFAIFHEKVDETKAGEVEVCVPCSDSELDEGVIERRSLPAMSVAYAVVPAEHAHFPDITAAYDAVAQRILAEGKLLGEAPRETYTDDTTEVAWPIGATAAAEHAT